MTCTQVIETERGEVVIVAEDGVGVEEWDGDIQTDMQVREEVLVVGGVLSQA